ncbi:hypothetical protein FRX31_012042 [Thalictrum thalictroides]|uniref:Zinc knuckle CX2CX4HX4C domain-containing protein n=1 Tax=Thalictrum thalictroides TaxID=46969 RepID=A0A7J6WLW9_THATH|nr:hypothetical protein FRX31_012042 [Thalictrum thalictroides]
MCRTRPSVARICVEMNIHEEMPASLWIEGPNFPGFWQPIYYPNFLYCSHCYKIGHSLQNCHKKNPQLAGTGVSPAGQPHTQEGKQLQKQGTWQTQRSKKVYRQVTNSNVLEAGPSGAKNSQGQEVNETQIVQKGTSNTFSVLNSIDDNNIEKEEGEVEAQDGEAGNNNMANTENSSPTTVQAGTATVEILDNLEDTQEKLNDNMQDSQEVLDGNLEEDLVTKDHAANNDEKAPDLDFTQVIDVNNAILGSSQNTGRTKGIAEEFISSEILNLEKEVLQQHSLAIPLAIEAPPDPTQLQYQPFLITNGDQSEEEQSEPEEGSCGEGDNHLAALEDHNSDSELLSRKKKKMPPSKMCTRSQTNPHGSTKKPVCQC